MPQANYLLSLPDSFGNLRHLTELDLQYCRKPAKLPDTFAGLSSLRNLYLDGSKNSGILNPPDQFGCFSVLQYLSLGSKSLKHLPPSIGVMCTLRQLVLVDFQELMCLPDVTRLTSITCRHMYRCSQQSCLAVRAALSTIAGRRVGMISHYSFLCEFSIVALNSTESHRHLQLP